MLLLNSLTPCKYNVSGQIEFELQQQSDEVMLSMTDKINELARKAPEAQIKQYMIQVDENFTERSFMPLDDVWERELGDLLDDIEN